MIDWFALGFSGMWLLGLGMILAAVGMAEYHASLGGEGFLYLLRQPGFRLVIDLGAMLVCLGLAGNATLLWKQGAWFGLAIGFGWLLWRDWLAFDERSNKPE